MKVSDLISGSVDGDLWDCVVADLMDVPVALAIQSNRYQARIVKLLEWLQENGIGTYEQRD